MSGTDLPLPQRGSSGITAAHIEALLDAALAAVPAPPLHDTSRIAAYAWLREVQAGLWSRRERSWMARRVIEAFHAEQSSAEAVERTRRALHRRLEAAEQRRAGTWWADKDTRLAQPPARFTVDDATWERHRRQAEAAGIGLGEHLGIILASHTSNGTPRRVNARTVDHDDTPPSRFIRIAVDNGVWADLKTAAENSNHTLTAHISIIIMSAP